MADTTEQETQIKNKTPKDVKVELFHPETEQAKALLQRGLHGITFGTDAVLEVDFSDSRGGAVYVSAIVDEPIFSGGRLDGYTKKRKSFQTKNTAIPKITDTEISFDIQTKSKMNSYNCSVYSRDTLSLVQKKSELEALELFFEANPRIENAILVSDFKSIFVSGAPTDVVGLLDGVTLGENTSTNMSIAEHEKENLKVYETPSNTLSVLFRAIDKSSLKKFLTSDGVRKIAEVIYSNKGLFEELRNTLGTTKQLNNKIIDAVSFAYSRIFQRAGDTIIDSAHGEDLTPARAKEYTLIYDIISSNERIARMFSLSEELFVGGMIDGNGFMSALSRDDIAVKWKEIFGFTPPTASFPVFDPQVGSGAGILGAFDKTNFNGIIKGLELRKNIAYTDDRISVLTGINTSLYCSSIGNLLHSSQIDKATDSLFSYLNPPYTSDDSVARDTIDMYKNGMIISGLFPTKLKGFLGNNLSSGSLILDIPRELTGYTDPKTPERFLFVIGTKSSYESHVKSHGEDNDSLTDYVKHGQPHFLTLAQDATIEQFSKALEIHIEKKNYTLKNTFYDMFKYYSESPLRESIVFSRIESMVAKQAEILENSERLNAGLDKNKDVVLSKFMPLEVARKSKVFVDPRFYSEDGVYERHTFDDVSQNVPLLVYYRDNMPSIFGLIVEIAQEKEISIPVEQSRSEPFILGEKPKKQKDIVTNLNLGMMKLKYYPSSIDLRDSNSKELLLETMLTVYKGQLNGQRVDSLRNAIALSDKMVIKSEKILRTDEESSQLLPKEVFVLLDNYGYDIGKLNMELDEFYQALEDASLFDINDYIELAQLSTDKKRSVIEGFIREMKSPIYAIAKYNNMDIDEVDKHILEKGAELFLKISKKQITMSELEEEILNFSEDYNLKGLFAEKFKINNENLISKIKIATSTTLTVLKKKTTDSLAEQIVGMFNDNPLKFYEDDKEFVFDSLEKDLLSLYGGDINKLENDMLRFKEAVVEELTPYFRIHTNINVSYSRMAETLIYRYAILKQAYKADSPDKAVNNLYDNIIGNMLSKTLGLLPHQIREAEGFLALSDEKDMEHLYAEMRSGKTRTFIATLFLLGLHVNKDITIILETANVPDITEQMIEAFPFMAMNSRFFGDPDKISTSFESSFENLIHDNMYPVPYRIFTQSKVRGGGETIEKLNSTLGEDMRETREVLKNIYGDGNVTRENLLKDYPKSKFKGLLTFSCE